MVSVRKLDPPANPDDIFYPEEDDEPMAESQLTGEEMVRLTETLQVRYEDQPDTYVWMNIFVYYEEFVSEAVFAPDVLVAFGVPKEPPRRTYKVWEEGRPPTVVFEVTSKHTRDRDIYFKWNLYSIVGIQEYILYDPHDHYLSPPLQGFRLVAGRDQPLDQDDDGALLSDALDLRLLLVNGRLRFFDRQTGEEQRSPAELLVLEKQAHLQAVRLADAEATQRIAAEARALAEGAQRIAAEARIAELEARLRGLGEHAAGPDG